MSYYFDIIFKNSRKLTLSLVAVFAVASCGSSSSGASKEDAAACEEFALVATSTINDMTSWIQDREDIEGTSEGFQASLAIAESMLTASSKAAEFSTKGSSKSAKKLFSAAETAFDEAGNAVAMRGGSLGPSEEALIKKAVESASEIGDFCGFGKS